MTLLHVHQPIFRGVQETYNARTKISEKIWIWFIPFRPGSYYANCLKFRRRYKQKKTCERLTRHLQKEDLGDRILDMHLTKNRRVFSRSRYLIIDGSDINKPYATTMEGIGRVHDGSTGEIVNGYWLMNMIGVEPKNECIHMLNSRLYSFSKYEDPEISENKVILGMTAKHREKVSEDQIVVIDRGGDRRVLIEQFLAWNQQFIIRQTGSRHLFLETKKYY